MVRFHWHVEDGYGASIPPTGLTTDQSGASGGTGAVQHAVINIEMPGGPAGAVRALFTLPADCMAEGNTREVGVLLGHDEPGTWQGTFMTALAVALAQSGFLVARYQCASSSEQQRMRVYEKTLDVAATSPFARFVQRWILGGVGNGARVAAVVGQRCRGSISGFVLVSYPLQAPLPLAAGDSLPDSSLPLMRIQPTQKLLLVAPTHAAAAADGGAAAGSAGAGQAATAEQLRAFAGRLRCGDVRLLELEGVDGHMQPAEGAPPPSGLLAGASVGDTAAAAAIVGVVAFCTAVAGGVAMDKCNLPCVAKEGNAGTHAAIDPGEGQPDPLAYELGCV